MPRIYMENNILITWLNDYIFCPKSIYCHNLYGDVDRVAYQNEVQINGANAHSAIDSGSYNTRSEILSGISVYCEMFNLTGKIDIFDSKTGILTERKKRIKTVYDGYIYQLYGQLFALREMGYSVCGMRLHSIDDNSNYPVKLPEDDPDRFDGFIDVINGINSFDPYIFIQQNAKKCAHCIYAHLCDSYIREGDEEC